MQRSISGPKKNNLFSREESLEIRKCLFFGLIRICTLEVAQGKLEGVRG